MNIRQAIEKVLNILIVFIFFTTFAVAIHELSHFYVAMKLGISGNITYTGDFAGLFNYLSTPTASQRLIIDLSGGLITGFIFLSLWYLSQRQAKYTAWELDDAFALFVVGIWQFIYGLEEGFLLEYKHFELIGQLTLIAVIIFALLIYGKQLYRFVNG